MREVLTEIIDRQNELDRIYPDRHKQIHKVCCDRCPSNQNKIEGFIDEEVEGISTYPKELIAKEYLFVCAWRPSKLCKGLCDNYGIDEQYIKSLK